MSIHTFGDSHSLLGWNYCNNIIVHHIGPVLCYSFGKEKLNRCDISKFGVKDDDTVIFCFGEIDCRCHIYKHVTKNNTYKMIIDDIVNNYVDAIKINVNKCNVKLKNICIYNVVPPPQPSLTALGGPSDYPYRGNDEERKSYILYFNNCLKQKCIENDWIYFDIYNSYIDDYGFLSTKLSDQTVHIQNGIFLRQFINKYLVN
jgi:hypothetical protein